MTPGEPQGPANVVAVGKRSHAVVAEERDAEDPLGP